MAGIYRRAIDGEDANALAEELEQLGHAPGQSGLAAQPAGQSDEMDGPVEKTYGVEEAFEEEWPDDSANLTASQARGSTYDLELYVAEKGIEIRCQCAGLEEAWTIPKTVIHRPHKAISVEMLFQRLSAEALNGCEVGQMSTNDAEFLLVRGPSTHWHPESRKSFSEGSDRSELTAVKLPPAVHELLRKPVRHPGSQTPLGDDPDRARLEVDSLEEFLSQIRPTSVIVEGVKAAKVRMVRALCRRTSSVIAPPPVFFDADMDEIRARLQEYARANLIVEVNSWGGWRLAKEAGVRLEGAPVCPCSTLWQPARWPRRASRE